MKTRTLIIGLIFAPLLGPLPAHAITPSDTQPSEAGEPPAAVSGERTAPQLSGDLTLREVLSATLKGSPRLASYSWEVRSSEAKVVQAGLRPNPELSVSPENFVGAGSFARQGQYQNTLQLSQLIELGDKRELRTQAAAAVRDQARVEYESTRVDVLGTATVDFIDAASAQEEVRVARLSLAQAEESVRAVEHRVKAGNGSLFEEKRARIQEVRAVNALRLSTRTLQVAKQKLAANWGSRGADVGEIRGDIFAIHPLPPLETLLARIERSPEHQLASAGERVQAAEAALARSRRVSDVVVSGAWRQGRNWDDQTVVAGVSFPLKIFDRAQGDIASSDALVEKSKAETASVEVRLRAAVYGLYQEIVQAKETAESITDELLPRTEEALALARGGFAQGVYSQLDLLDAQRTVVEVRRERIEAGAKYHRLVAEMEKLLGAPL